MLNNALQIAEQYKHLRNEFLDGSFSKYLNDYRSFDGGHMSSMEIRINKLIDAGQYDEAVSVELNWSMLEILYIYRFR